MTFITPGVIALRVIYYARIVKKQGYITNQQKVSSQVLEHLFQDDNN